MIYKLFRNVKNNKIYLDMSYDKQDIIDALGSYIGCFLTIDYSIYKNENFHDEKVADIKSIDDYVSFKYGIKKLEKKKYE